MEEERKNLPVYMFKKLNRHFVVSTYTGNFYMVSKKTYSALEKWNAKLMNLDT